MRRSALSGKLIPPGAGNRPVGQRESSFTEEGGCYIWTRLAFGRFVAGINTVLYWLSNPVWMGGLLCITAVETFNTFYGDLGGVGKYVFAFVFFIVMMFIRPQGLMARRS